LIYWITIFFTILIAAGVIYCAVRFRMRSGSDQSARPAGHSTTLELTWTIIPTIIVLLIFYYGFRSFLAQAVIPPDAYEIRAHGQMWSWSFRYPDGFVSTELHLPKDVPVRLVLTSEDVLHSLYIPAFRAKKDVVPGRFNKMWFTPTMVGEYQLFCAEYCGTDHSGMLAKVFVHDHQGWLEWEETSRVPWENYDTPLAHGKALAERCLSCHTVDGSASTGPTWQNLYGSQRQFTDRTSALADEDYIRESILDPGTHIVDGYSNQMPSFRGQLREVDIESLIVYMKSLSEHYTGGEIDWAAVRGVEGESDSPDSPQE